MSKHTKRQLNLLYKMRFIAIFLTSVWVLFLILYHVIESAVANMRLGRSTRWDAFGCTRRVAWRTGLIFLLLLIERFRLSFAWNVEPESYLEATETTFSLKDPPVSVVRKLLAKLNERKAAGLDNIPSRLLTVNAISVVNSTYCTYCT